MEFRKNVTITLYAKHKKRHRCIEQTFGLYGRRRGWDDLREQHRNMDKLSRVKQIVSPGWRHETSAWGGGTGMTQRDGMGREVGHRVPDRGHICIRG